MDRPVFSSSKMQVVTPSTLYRPWFFQLKDLTDLMAGAYSRPLFSSI